MFNCSSSFKWNYHISNWCFLEAIDPIFNTNFPFQVFFYRYRSHIQYQFPFHVVDRYCPILPNIHSMCLDGYWSQVQDFNNIKRIFMMFGSRLLPFSKCWSFGIFRVQKIPNGSWLCRTFKIFGGSQMKNNWFGESCKWRVFGFSRNKIKKSTF